MAVAGLVADDEYVEPQRAAPAQKEIGAVEHHRAADTRAVNMPLQPLPGELAVRQQPDRVAHLALRATEIAGHETALAGGTQKHPIVVDQRVVEIGADPEAQDRRSATR